MSLLSTTGSSSATSPRTDALTQLLVQGLHSSDARILDSVLDRADITVTLAVSGEIFRNHHINISAY